MAKGDPLVQIRADHAKCCSITSFKESGCSIKLPREAEWMALSGTRYSAAHGFGDKLCDVLLLWHTTSKIELSAVFEVKARAVHVQDIREQLQGGADVLAPYLASKTSRANFRAFLVHGSMKSINRRALDRQFVSLGGKRFKIETMSCGDAVADKLLK